MNIKPFPLDWKILNILKKCKKLNVHDITDALEGVYKIDAVRKLIFKMEKSNLVCSSRESRIKYYSLGEAGIEELKKLDKTNGLTEEKYYEIIYKWDKATEKGKLMLNEELVKSVEKMIKFQEEKEKYIKDNEERRKLLKSIKDIKILTEQRCYGVVVKTTYVNKDKIGLVIQRESEGEKLLNERIEQIIKAGLKLKVIYVVLLDTERKYELQNEINSTKIERIEI